MFNESKWAKEIFQLNELLSTWRADPSAEATIVICDELAANRRWLRYVLEAHQKLQWEIAAVAAHYSTHVRVLLAMGRFLLAIGDMPNALEILVQGSRLALRGERSQPVRAFLRASEPNRTRSRATRIGHWKTWRAEHLRGRSGVAPTYGLARPAG